MAKRPTLDAQPPQSGNPDTDKTIVKEWTPTSIGDSPDDIKPIKVKEVVDDLLNGMGFKLTSVADTEENDPEVSTTRPHSEALKFRPPQPLVDRYRELYPNAEMPDFEAIAEHMTRIEVAFERVKEINRIAPKKRFTPAQREALGDGAREVFSAESFQKTYQYFIGLYVEILLYFKGVSHINFEHNIINEEDFSLKPEPVGNLSEIITKMKNAYPTVARELMSGSEVMATLMLDRLDEMKSMAARGEAPRPNRFQHNTREHALKALINAEDTVKAASMCNSRMVCESLATALEVSLYTITHFAADNLAPGFRTDAEGKYAFERLYPFKVDFVIAASSCLMILMPQIRQILALLAHIDKATQGMSQ